MSHEFATDAERHATPEEVENLYLNTAAALTERGKYTIDSTVKVAGTHQGLPVLEEEPKGGAIGYSCFVGGEDMPSMAAATLETGASGGVHLQYTEGHFVRRQDGSLMEVRPACAYTVIKDLNPTVSSEIMSVSLPPAEPAPKNDQLSEFAATPKREPHTDRFPTYRDAAPAGVMEKSDESVIVESLKAHFGFGMNRFTAAEVRALQSVVDVLPSAAGASSESEY